MLDDIAWYGGNSGVGFELENGQDADWSEKQYAFDKAGTHPVRQKRPNQWGLYDMLGNVFEWCADGQREYTAEPQSDPTGPARGFRVFRGGSWFDFARYVRAAFRNWFEPGFRIGNLGFRAARSGSGAEPAHSRQGGLAEQGRKGARATGGAYLNLRGGEAPHVAALPKAARARITTDRARLELEQRPKPAWASAMGRDRYGLWSEFTFRGKHGEASQRMRWCPPGEFRMGSPAEEDGRFEHEGPQHLARLSHGFWLFDTPCTQALWQAVTGDNPSRFISPTRPVEQVSWDDVQGFFEIINEKVESLDLSLPSEAQWEYACRAGTTTSTYMGDAAMLGDANAPLLDTIAWYPGNSGRRFELENGVDMTGVCSDFQYADATVGGTHPVGQKLPNPWGLHDMLGNVFEWCDDEPRDYSDEPATNPLGSDKARGIRVVRGGSWVVNARDVRAACRYWFEPGSRVGSLGFRAARVQAEP